MSAPIRATLQRPAMQEYRNRDSHCHRLDDRWFEALNDGALLGTGMSLMLSGCLDALDAMPAGSMVSTGNWWGHAHYDQQLVIRGVSLAELEERGRLADELIAEIRREAPTDAIPGPLATHSQGEPRYFGASWYSRDLPNDGDRLDEINLGMYHVDGGTTGEFSIVFELLSGKPTCRLIVFDDGWSALARFTDFLTKLAELDPPPTGQFNTREKIVLPSEVLARLRDCGIVDKTKREAPPQQRIRHGGLPTPPAIEDEDAHFLMMLRRHSPPTHSLPTGFL